MWLVRLRRDLHHQKTPAEQSASAAAENPNTVPMPVRLITPKADVTSRLLRPDGTVICVGKSYPKPQGPLTLQPGTNPSPSFRLQPPAPAPAQSTPGPTPKANTKTATGNATSIRYRGPHGCTEYVYAWRTQGGYRTEAEVSPPPAGRTHRYRTETKWQTTAHARQCADRCRD